MGSHSEQQSPVLGLTQRGLAPGKVQPRSGWQNHHRAAMVELTRNLFPQVPQRAAGGDISLEALSLCYRLPRGAAGHHAGAC